MYRFSLSPSPPPPLPPTPQFAHPTGGRERKDKEGLLPARSGGGQSLHRLRPLHCASVVRRDENRKSGGARR